MLVSMATTCNLAVSKFLFRVGTDSLQLRDAVNRVDGETETVCLVINCQLHGRIDVPLLFVTAHVQVSLLAQFQIPIPPEFICAQGRIRNS